MVRLGLVMTIGLGLASCGGDSTGSLGSRGILLSVVSGDQQTGTVGEDLSQPIRVLVTDDLNNPLADHVVSFEVTAGNGDIARTVRTDQSGIATAVWRLGTVAWSDQTLEARAVSLDGAKRVMATLTADAHEGPPDTLAVLAGAGQRAIAGYPVSTPPAVRVTDRFGNPVPGLTVQFVVTAGGGSAQGAQVLTDSSGHAAVQQWVLGGTEGPNTLAATAAGLAAVSFDAVAASPVATKLRLVTNPSPAAQSGVSLVMQPVVQVLNYTDDPLPYAGIQISAMLASGTGSLTGTPVATTNAQGRAGFADLAIFGAVGDFTLGFASTGLTGVTSSTIMLTPGLPAMMSLVMGDSQSVFAGSPLPQSVSVLVTDSAGNGVPGVTVDFIVGQGGGSVPVSSVMTAGDGIASPGTWTLGPLSGPNTLIVKANAGPLAADSVVAYATALGDFWTPRQSMAVPRRFAGFGVIGGKLYTAGGKDVNLTTVDTVEVFNPATNSWSGRRAMSTPRVGPGAGVINDKLYIAGGNGGTSFAMSSAEAYDPQTNAWTPIAPMPGARAFPAFGVINGILYLAGGADNNGQLSSVISYDPATNTWATLAPLPAPRNDAMGVVANNMLYVVGGQQGNTVDGAMMVYDPATDTWTVLPSMPTPRFHVNVEQIDDKIYVVSGLLSASTTSPVVEAFDPRTLTWSTRARVPTPRTAGMVGAIDGILYLAGGSDNGVVTAAAEAYVP
ncbi:MAG: kelch repeat-containing protein [Gemmatimonadales bacterium]